MAMGEPIGYAARLTMNNTSRYQNQSNALPRAVFINLLGDPTLRLESVAPPSNLMAFTTNGVGALSWSPSPDSVVGYHVYRSASADGPFTRLTASPIPGTSYTDSTASSFAGRTYMVRAVALQTNPSGSYYNPSEGIFVSASVGSQPPLVPIIVSAALTPHGVKLSWNSQGGLPYHVEAKEWLQENNWTDVSGPIVADASATTSFVDTNWVGCPARLYRVVGE
jgi:hypothetical protein